MCSACTAADFGLDHSGVASSWTNPYGVKKKKQKKTPPQPLTLYFYSVSFQDPQWPLIPNNIITDVDKSGQIIFALAPSRQLAAPRCYSVKLGRGTTRKSAFSSRLEADLVRRQLQHRKTRINHSSHLVGECAHISTGGTFKQRDKADVGLRGCKRRPHQRGFRKDEKGWEEPRRGA